MSIQDRAFQFGDGVYEVCQVRGGALIDETRHLARLKTSLAALRIAAPVGEAALQRILREVVARNRVSDGLALSPDFARRRAARSRLSRRLASRRGSSSPPNRSIRALGEANAEPRRGGGHACPTNAGRIRISRSLQLLPNVLAKQAAREAGAYEAWFVDRDGFVTEGASTNAWIVAEDGAWSRGRPTRRSCAA